MEQQLHRVNVRSQLEKHLKRNDYDSTRELLEAVHPADIAEILDSLPIEHAVVLTKLLDNKKTSGILPEIDHELLNKILQELTAQEIADKLAELDTDDASDILNGLSIKRRHAVIECMQDEQHKLGILELMRYDEDSAGSIMAKELVYVNENWDVSRSLEEIKRQAEKVDKIYSIYVTDDRLCLKGRISLKDILTNSKKKHIKEIYIQSIEHVSVDDSSEEVAQIMSKYDLESIPVVDKQEHLVGRITIDDVIDVIREGAERDYKMAAGITGGSSIPTNIWKSGRMRLPWLLIGGVGGLGAAAVIGNFKLILDQYPILIMFIPLIQSTAGNVGVQSSAIMVQSIANNSFDSNILKRLTNEVLLGLINGLAITFLVLNVCYFLFEIPMNLSFTIATALITVIINAGVIGTFIPFFLNKRKIDPALATGPFITTSADILGVFIYFLIAKWILGM